MRKYRDCYISLGNRWWSLLLSSTDSSPVSLKWMLQLELASVVIENAFVPDSRIWIITKTLLLLFQIEYLISLHYICPGYTASYNEMFSRFLSHIFPWEGLHTLLLFCALIEHTLGTPTFFPCAILSSSVFWSSTSNFSISSCHSSPENESISCSVVTNSWWPHGL